MVALDPRQMGGHPEHVQLGVGEVAGGMQCLGTVREICHEQFEGGPTRGGFRSERDAWGALRPEDGAYPRFVDTGVFTLRALA
ncbi:hypothetical protein GCM10009625_33760 [Brachybacterium fresconis]